MLPQLGPVEFIIILVIFIIFFGAGKLGDLGSALAKGIREFRQSAGIESPKKSDETNPPARPQA